MQVGYNSRTISADSRHNTAMRSPATLFNRLNKLFCFFKAWRSGDFYVKEILKKGK